MEQKIVELQDQIGSLQPATSEQKSHESELLEDDQQELEKAWIEEKTKVSHAEQAVDGDSGAAQIWASMSVLDFSIKVRVSPLQLRKVGAIIKNMQGANYSDEQINDVCRALFLTQSEEDMAVAWKVFDADESGFLDGEEFKKALPLLGENILPSQIEKLFAEVDTDGSGRIEFPEFCVMVKAMNPKEEEE